MGSRHPRQGKAPSGWEKQLPGRLGGSGGVKSLLDGSTGTTSVPSSPPSSHSDAQQRLEKPGRSPPRAATRLSPQCLVR